MKSEQAEVCWKESFIWAQEVQYVCLMWSDIFGGIGDPDPVALQQKDKMNRRLQYTPVSLSLCGPDMDSLFRMLRTQMRCRVSEIIWN
jgi:hypothetical protein